MDKTDYEERTTLRANIEKIESEIRNLEESKISIPEEIKAAEAALVDLKNSVDSMEYYEARNQTLEMKREAVRQIDEIDREIREKESRLLRLKEEEKNFEKKPYSKNEPALASSPDPSFQWKTFFIGVFIVLVGYLILFFAGFYLSRIPLMILSAVLTLAGIIWSIALSRWIHILSSLVMMMAAFGMSVNSSEAVKAINILSGHLNKDASIEQISGLDEFYGLYFSDAHVLHERARIYQKFDTYTKFRMNPSGNKYNMYEAKGTEEMISSEYAVAPIINDAGIIYAYAVSAGGHIPNEWKIAEAHWGIPVNKMSPDYSVYRNLVWDHYKKMKQEIINQTLAEKQDFGSESKKHLRAYSELKKQDYLSTEIMQSGVVPLFFWHHNIISTAENTIIMMSIIPFVIIMIFWLPVVWIARKIIQ